MKHIENFYTTLPTQIDRFIKGLDLDYSKDGCIIAKGKNEEINFKNNIGGMEL
jgi:hypothetical protein